MKTNLGVDLLVSVYEIRNDTVFNHSSIMSGNMALKCPDIVFYPANMRLWPNIGLLLAHRLRSWPNSKSALSQRLMFAGYVQYLLHIMQEILDIPAIYMNNSAMPYISKLGSRFIGWKIGLLESVTFQLLLRMLSSFPAVIKKL